MNARLLRVVRGVLVIALLAIPLPALAAAPTNDDFANATFISGLPFSDTVDNTQATTESAEPQYCASVYRSVWYKFTPSSNVAVRVGTSGAGFSDTIVNVYRDTGGGLGGLSFLDCATNSGSTTFLAQAGNSYYLQAADMTSGGGNLTLNLAEVPPPANDNFLDAVQIGSLPFSQTVDTAGSTREAGEPMSSCALSFNPPGGTVWYTFTAGSSGSVSGSISGASFASVTTAYSGNSLAGLTEMRCLNYANPVTIHVDTGQTVYFQVGALYGSGGTMEFQLVVTPPPVAYISFGPYDPSVFDSIFFCDSSYDPGGLGIQSRSWDFGDGSTSTDQCVTHRYVADADYNVQLEVMTPDGRMGSTSQIVQVRTHDIAISKFSVPTSASSGQTRSITVGIRNSRYPETVEVQVYKGTTAGWVYVGSLIQTVPVRPANRTTNFVFSYTFTSDDAAIGKVSFRAQAFIRNARDALQADNEATSLPTRVNR